MRSESKPMDKLPSKREQQVMEVVYRRGLATAKDVFRALPDAPSYNAVRGVLSALEEKGHLIHTRVGRQYVYRPAVSGRQIGRSELSRILRTFFDGSKARLVSALLDDETPSAGELEQMRRLIDEARSAADGASDS